MSCASWFGNDMPNAPEPVAKVAFAKIFGGAQMNAGSSAANESVLRNRVRLLDFAGKDLERFMKNMGTEDREAAGVHLASVERRQQELNQLLLSSPATCSRPPEPTMDYVVKNETNVPARSKIMMDMLVDALKCGVTRTACNSLYDTNGYHAYFSWLNNINPDLGKTALSSFNSAHFHAMAHSNGQNPGQTMYRDANRWLFEQYAYLVKRLAIEPDHGGTMLDNTVVLYADTLSDGGGHQVKRLPWVIAGNANGFFKTGRHVRLAKDTAPNGLFAAIAEAVGATLPGSGFGDPKFGLTAYAPVRG